MLALALGAKTLKMHQGHHGANHPVKDFTTNKVEIVSMNHGFAVDRESLPLGVVETHVSLFDGSNCGIALEGKPVFGICLGHQMLALALGAKTLKMHQGHHGANHPVKDFTTNKVEIVSMNHGFAVDRESLPLGVVETHVSLFDGSNCGIALEGKPVFSVQHHPEASPGPQDSHYLFKRFVGLMEGV